MYSASCPRAIITVVMSKGQCVQVARDSSASDSACISSPVVCHSEDQNTCACRGNGGIDSRDDDARHSDDKTLNLNMPEAGYEDSTDDSDNENYDNDYVRGRQKAQITGRSRSLLAPRRQSTTRGVGQPPSLGNSSRSRSAVSNSRDCGTLLAKLAASHATSDVVIDAADSVVNQEVSQRHKGKVKFGDDDNRSHKEKPRVHRVYEGKINRSQGRDAKAREGDVSE
ncbi:hypothetical protein BD410DRAFT_520257 [Rickenella mellea]|uniref:Uncharacterized protein n=1 Tax=Rickenella mellea TaxID=50990 RepID=A0A4Y7QGE7_9AGAM|nr:hypothetical protein BD410DRAFT_520257 [Rickenella mellea]